MRKIKADIFCWFIETAFENGCLGQLDLTVAIKGDWHEGFQVYGEKGSVFGKTYNPWYHKAREVKCYSHTQKQYFQPLDNRANTYQLQLEAFADTVLYGKPMRATSLEEGIASVRGMLAVKNAVESGEWVQLKEVEGRV